MKKIFIKGIESFKHNWYLYLLGFSHLGFWFFIYFTVCEVITGNFDVNGIVDLNEVLFSHLGHEYTLFDMWFFMTISVFMFVFLSGINFVNGLIFKAIANRDYDRQVKSKNP